jgi:hypothetical protein
MYKGYRHSCKKPRQSFPELKGSYYVVNRVLYSYAWLCYLRLWKEKYALTQKYRDSSLVFPQTVATTHHYSSGIINRKGQEDQSLQRLLAIFPTISLSDPDRAFLPTSFLMPIIKKKRQGEKRWLAISAISDLSWLKENISLRNLAFYYTKRRYWQGLQYIQRSLEDALFCSMLKNMRYLKWCHYQWSKSTSE